MLRIVILMTALSMTLVLHESYASKQEPPNKQYVDWTNSYIIATGRGAPNLSESNLAGIRIQSERTAKVDARRNILNTVKQLRVSDTTSIHSLLNNQPQLNQKLNDLVRDYETLETKYYADGGVDIQVKLHLTKILLAVQDSTLGSAPPEETTTTKTGIIIQSSGLNTPPALAPYIRDQQGETLFSPEFVSKTTAQRNGLVVYVTSLKEALNHERIGPNPEVVNVLSLAKAGSADLVVSEADAEKLRGLSSLLKQAKIVIIRDESGS